MKFIIKKAIVLVGFLLVFSSYVYGFSLSDQGTGVRNISSGSLIDGDLRVVIYNQSVGGGVLFDELFVGVVVNGSWNVMLTGLDLEMGTEYFKDYIINGENVNFTNHTGGVVDRQSFFSPIGNPKTLSIKEELNVSRINFISAFFDNLVSNWLRLSGSLNVTGGIVSNGKNVCLEDGTNCPAGSSGDITSVNTTGNYIYGGAVSNDVNLYFNESRLNDTIDSRIPSTYNWSEITNRPSGLDDGDDFGSGVNQTSGVYLVINGQIISLNESELNNTILSIASQFDDSGSIPVNLSELVNDEGYLKSGEFSINWSNVTNVPSDLLDGDQDTTYTYSDWQLLNRSQYNSLSNFTNDVGYITNQTMNKSVDWNNIDNRPAGLDDGDDVGVNLTNSKYLSILNQNIDFDETKLNSTVLSLINLSGNTSAFKMYLNNSQTIGAGSNQILFNATLFDSNNDINLTTSSFNPKIAGKYILTASAWFSSLGTDKTFYIYIQKNQNTIASGSKQSAGIITGASSIVTTIVDAVPGDNFTVGLWHDDSVSESINAGVSSTFFSGARIDSDSYWSKDSTDDVYYDGNVNVTGNLTVGAGTIKWNDTGFIFYDGSTWKEFGTGNSNQVSGGGVPYGTIAAFYNESCPSGWVLADGTNGTPDLRGIFIRGAGTSGILQKANGNNFSAIFSQTYNDSLQGHWHSVHDKDNNNYAFFTQDNSPSGSGYRLSQSSSSQTKDLQARTIISDGTNGPQRTGSETAPASYALTYCMNVDGTTSSSVGGMVLKQYSEAEGDFNVTGNFWTTTRAVAIPYQTIDGTWRLRFNIAGNTNSDSGKTLTFSGVVFKDNSHGQAISVHHNDGTSISQVYGRVDSGTSTLLYFFSSTVTSVAISGDVELEEKPTWADDAVESVSYWSKDVDGNVYYDSGNVTVSENLNVSKNITIGDRIIMGFGEVIDNMYDGWVRIVGSLELTGDLKLTNGVLEFSDGTNISSATEIGTSSSGESITKTINQLGHGFSVGNVVYYNGTHYLPAIANESEKLGIGIVSDVNGDEFDLVISGYVYGLSGLNAGSYYFTSDTVAGNLSLNESNYYSNPMLLAINDSTALVFSFRASEPQSTPLIAETPGQIAAFNSVDCPDGWILADGTDGTPDLRGIFVRGAGENSILNNTNNEPFNASFGEYQNDMIEEHSHNVDGSTSGSVGVYSSFLQANNNGAATNYANAVTTGRSGVETRPANVVLTYCVKTESDTQYSNSIWQKSGNIVKLANSSQVLSIPMGIRDSTRDLKIYDLDTSTINLTAKEIIMQDSDYNSIRVVDVELLINISHSGVDGLAEDETEQSSTWYYIWVISNGTDISGLLSSSVDNPTLPSTYSYKGLFGAVRNDGSSDFRNFYQHGQFVAAASRTALSGGTVNSQLTAVSLVDYIPENARKIGGSVTSDHSSSTIGETNIAATASGIGYKNFRIDIGSISAGTVGLQSPFELTLVEKQTMYYEAYSNGFSSSISISSWEY